MERLPSGVDLGGRYRLEERIGAGGMGEVWRATDTVLGRTVAVKVVLAALVDEPGFSERFLIEARAMASLRHPGVVAIHDYRSDAQVTYLVMEYVDGEPLSQVLRRLGRLDWQSTMNLVAQAADALAAAHERGIVHRDVKPANLLVRRDGTVVLTDFGIARSPGGAALTSAGAIMGTPSYLAPEQVLGEPATPRSDIYALGVVAYECLAGRRPFDGENPFAVAMQRLHQPPPPLGVDTPEPVRRVVGHALATDPRQRWGSATELATAARTALAGRASAPAPRGAAPAPTRRRRMLLVGAATAVVLVVAATVWALTRGGAPPAGGSSAAPTSGANRTVTTPAVSAPAASAGLVPCGALLCPAEPMCWGGLESHNGVASPPHRLDCAEPHYWETFVVGGLPPDALDVRQDELIERADIAALCSEEAMAGRDRQPSGTQGWRRDAWPVRTGDQTWILHCIANSNEGETTGSQFRVGA